MGHKTCGQRDKSSGELQCLETRPLGSGRDRWKRAARYLAGGLLHVAGVTTWKARLGKPVVGPRVTGEPLEPDAATRNAQRPKGEKRQLASRMLENKHVRFWGVATRGRFCSCWD